MATAAMIDCVRGRTKTLKNVILSGRRSTVESIENVGAIEHDGIWIRGLRKRFGPVTALDGVDLDVRPGEIVVLLGPNGAGKSTLTRIIATIVLPDEGTVRVAGFDVVVEPSAARRRIGLTLGDERSWYWRLSGRQNLEFFASLYGLRRSAAAERAIELLDIVGLTEAADRRFGGYSTGMKMRLSLARALLPNPSVMLLDEPTRSLDPVAAAGFRDHITRLAKENDKAILYATHDLHEAASVADRLFVLARGRLIAEMAQGAESRAIERVLLEAVKR